METQISGHFSGILFNKSRKGKKLRNSENGVIMFYQKIAQLIDDAYNETSLESEKFPRKEQVANFIFDVQKLFFPTFFGEPCKGKTTKQALVTVANDLEEILNTVYGSECGLSQELTEKFVQRLPDVRRILGRDLVAFYEGDPAAKTKEEIVLCYPGFYAVMLYRIAHELFLLHVPFLPRMITETAHGRTGIDIHPGATIGEYFFIDHGTGIVVGETTVIGNRVRLYQGVTLGAKSFRLDEDGNPVKGGKRHPTIGNNVIIYANATILGGKTVVGDGCVIGGNVWLTESVNAGEIVHYSPKEKA